MRKKILLDTKKAIIHSLCFSFIYKLILYMKSKYFTTKTKNLIIGSNKSQGYIVKHIYLKSFIYSCRCEQK